MHRLDRDLDFTKEWDFVRLVEFEERKRQKKEIYKGMIMMVTKDGNEDLKRSVTEKKIAVSMYFDLQCDKIIVLLG